MNVIIFAVCVNIAIVRTSDIPSDFESIINTLKGRRSIDPETAETNVPVEAIKMMPGFFLLKPKGMSKSSFKYPIGKPNVAYSKSDHVDARQDNIETRNMDAGSRNGNLLAKIFNAVKNINENQESEKYYKSDELSENTDLKNGKLLSKILKVVRNINNNLGSETRLKPSVIVIKTKPSVSLKTSKSTRIEDYLNGKQNLDDLINELENNAREYDDDDEAEYSGSGPYKKKIVISRRKSEKGEGRNRSGAYQSSRESGSVESDHDKNPGNPFTIHKNKYKQNWLWNHFMDGDHMNINPLGPQFSNLGPSGPELFFGRKWWYFNQDDYKPMG